MTAVNQSQRNLPLDGCHIVLCLAKTDFNNLRSPTITEMISLNILNANSSQRDGKKALETHISPFLISVIGAYAAVI